MGIKIGDIEIANEILDLNYQVLRTQMILDEIIKSNPNMNRPTTEVLKQIDSKAIELLQKKYPTMGISKK